MRKSLYIVCLVLLSNLVGFSQQTITLTFTAIDSASYVQLDKIKVMNHTQGGDTTLFWNDTVLELSVPVGLSEQNDWSQGFNLRSFPNPVNDKSTIELTIPEHGTVELGAIDVLGRPLNKLGMDLEAGKHKFSFSPGAERLCLISATWKGYRKTIKVVNSSQIEAQQCKILYQGQADLVATEETTEVIQGFTFEPGDTLLYIGSVDTLESGLLDTPDASQTYVFQYACNIPCIGIPSVTYEGQVYNTVQIFSQCWLKENLNVGVIINGDSNMTDNGIIEKYCYNDEPDSCIKYGGLYQWNELMQYNPVQGSRGICPPGWHIPTDDEWKILEGAADSQYGIGKDVWELEASRGLDAGKNLKSTSGWNMGGNGYNLYGFAALPGGFRYQTGFFIASGNGAYHHTSTKTVNNWPTSNWSRILYYDWDDIDRSFTNMSNGGSVRCIRDKVI